MPVLPRAAIAVVVCAVFVVAADKTFARVDVKVEFDKKFNFKAIRTWAWHPAGAGTVMMGRTQQDDPDAMQRLAEPVIVKAVETEMPRRKMQQVATEPGLVLAYYLLLSTNMSAQTMGQFLPSTVAWGLPPFAQATQSLEFMHRGSLVLDFSADGTVVWRGVAQANIKMDADLKRRESLIGEGVRDLLRRFPPRQ